MVVLSLNFPVALSCSVWPTVRLVFVAETWREVSLGAAGGGGGEIVLEAPLPPQPMHRARGTTTNTSDHRLAKSLTGEKFIQETEARVEPNYRR